MESARAGGAARDAAKWEAAEIAYRAALRAADAAKLTEAQRAEIVGELGLVELALRKYRDAAEHLSESLAHGEALSIPLQRRLEAGRKQAEAHVVRVYLGISPPDAQVFLDGEALAGTGSSRRLFVDPGQHTVRARMDGYTDVIIGFDAEKAGKRTVTVNLQLSQRAPPAISKPALIPAVAPSTSIRDELRMVGFIAAGAAIAVGTGLTISAAVQDDKMQAAAASLGSGYCSQRASSAPCADLQRRAAKRDLTHGAGLTSLLGGGVLAGLTVTSLWWAPSDERSPAPVQVSATLHPLHTGFVITSVW